MDPIHTRLTAIENIVEDCDDVSAYSWAKVRGRSNKYGVRLNATVVPQRFLELMEDPHTNLDYIKSSRPTAIRVQVKPDARFAWEDIDYLR